MRPESEIRERRVGIQADIRALRDRLIELEPHRGTATDLGRELDEAWDVVFTLEVRANLLDWVLGEER